MSEPRRDPAIRGKTIRFIWTEGPTAGKAHDHTFHDNGTVEWRDGGSSERASPAETSRPPDKPAYAAIEVAEQVCLVSYLAASGYTLTVVLNFQDRQLTGFASGAKEWFPVRGRFEVLGR